jgi:hypothetical protein
MTTPTSGSRPESPTIPDGRAVSSSAPSSCVPTSVHSGGVQTAENGRAEDSLPSTNGVAEGRVAAGAASDSSGSASTAVADPPSAAAPTTATGRLATRSSTLARAQRRKGGACCC